MLGTNGSTARKARIVLAAIFLSLVPALATAHGIAEGDRQAMLAGGSLRFVWLGASHMLTGYDHLLFIFGVIFFVRSVRETVKLVTAFTLGHSITLVLATVLGVSADYHVVDAFIALTVCYKGFENLDGFRRWLGRPSPSLLPVIFVFGLVHGFGLSTRLQQLPLGEEGLVLRILSFNVGVELGQLAALSAMVALLAGWRRTRSFERFATLSNGGLVAAGVALFLVQIHGFGHSAGWQLLGPSTAQAQTLAGSPEGLDRAMAAYDRAFVGRDVMALWELFDEEIVLVEQGTQNVGREEALGKHLGPDLETFQELAAEYADVRVRRAPGAATRTRLFTVKGRLPTRPFYARGYETQSWALREGEWRLVHMHWSFPVR